jgi:hypothetical protein
VEEGSRAAHQARQVKGKPPQLVVDPGAVRLDRNKIIVQHTPDGGYFCIGFGPSAEFLRAVDEDDRFGTAVDIAAAGLDKRGSPFRSNEDGSSVASAPRSHWRKTVTIRINHATTADAGPAMARVVARLLPRSRTVSLRRRLSFPHCVSSQRGYCPERRQSERAPPKPPAVQVSRRPPAPSRSLARFSFQ